MVEATDRWRIAVATLATIAALPVLVGSMGSRSEGASVAAVPGGADLADALRGGSTSDAPAPRATIGPQRSNLPRATQPSQPPVLEIAVPASDPATTAKGLGSYRHFAGARPGSVPCHTPAVPVGAQVKVENLDNGHEVTCTVVSNLPLPNGLLITVATEGFTKLGDPVQSPIPVRLTW
jgi:hypothetical protein